MFTLPLGKHKTTAAALSRASDLIYVGGGGRFDGDEVIACEVLGKVGQHLRDRVGDLGPELDDRALPHRVERTVRVLPELGVMRPLHMGTWTADV